MNVSTLHIENPSEPLLEFARQLKADKENRKKELKDNWDNYFPEK